MLDVLQSILDGIITVVDFFVGIFDWIGSLFGTFSDTMKLVNTFSVFFPASVFATIIAIISVAVIYKILELLP